ncbi:hypothetical protein GUITHDRAFT_99885 [Guillardia theta CCMP2712]|uniref:Uncharacterized protein n=1 Tax=Guillardia theta (strain CCMP2712) TaxID=905079 RepID=L1K1S5_GUITC|nr:hypothetical protein GUITHDRAFT_99885 [Guillardia theta CCMP2712]EKX54405.1 hypothetical protein GUITHDRAFT_99885 [Guillardia theta CCMP2712]|eukprot:XP_005841385.1 hypothetical protein GUITHDRAFT_99885 [Guillardia theta CCMP2712]
MRGRRHAAGAAAAAGMLLVLICDFGLEGTREEEKESSDELQGSFQQGQESRAGGRLMGAWKTDDLNAFAAENSAVERFPSIVVVPPGMMHLQDTGMKPTSTVQPSPRPNASHHPFSWQRVNSHHATQVEKSLRRMDGSEDITEDHCYYDQPEMLVQELRHSICDLHSNMGEQACAQLWSQVRQLQGDSVGYVLQQERDWNPKFRSSFSQFLYKISAPTPSMGSGDQLGYVTSGFTLKGPLATWFPRGDQAGAAVASCQPVDLSWNLDYLSLNWLQGNRIPFAVKDCAGKEVSRFSVDCRSHPFQGTGKGRSSSKLNLEMLNAKAMHVEEEAIRGPGSGVLGWQFYITGEDGEAVGSMIRINSANKAWILQANRAGQVDLRLLVMVASILDFTFYKKVAGFFVGFLVSVLAVATFVPLWLCLCYRGKRGQRGSLVTKKGHDDDKEGGIRPIVEVPNDPKQEHRTEEKSQEQEQENLLQEENDLKAEEEDLKVSSVPSSFPSLMHASSLQENADPSSVGVELEEAIAAIDRAIDRNSATRNSRR